MGEDTEERVVISRPSWEAGGIGCLGDCGPVETKHDHIAL